MFLVFEPGRVLANRLLFVESGNSTKSRRFATEQRRPVQDADGHAGKPKQTYFFVFVALPSFSCSSFEYDN